MKSKILILTLVLALLLGACQAATPLENSEASPAPSGGQTTEEASAPTQAATATQPAQTSLTGSEPMPGCRVTGAQLKPNPTLEALFPAVSEKDWIKGPSDATVTILDYSDFQ